MSITHHPAPITEDDETLRAAVDQAELPALLTTLAHVTGDLSLLDPHLRPALRTSPGAIPPQGGMTVEQQQQARAVAFEALCRFRDGGSIVAAEPSGEVLKQLMSFIAGDAGEEYLPLMSHEINLPSGVGAPGWTLEQLAPDRDFRIAVIGAGMSGLATAYRLSQAGIPFVVFEKNDDVGGTWYENRYPGCRLDTNNFAYSFSFAQKEDWPQQFSPRDSVHGYFRDVAEDLGIRPNIRFGTEVQEAAYNASSGAWDLAWTTTTGVRETGRFNVVVSAVGQLNRPNIPEYPGQENFTGKAWHTAEWDQAVDLSGKRVAVIGTGASAFQVIPTIAGNVEQLTVFQRNAPWMYPTPNYLDKIAPGLLWLFRVVPYYHRWFRFFQFWTSVEGRRRFITVDPSWDKPGSVSEANESMRFALTEYLQEQFAERPDLLEKVIPSYPPGAKRLLRDNGIWAEALKRDNVSLVSESIREFTEEGIRTEDGVEHRVDVVIYGTGFKASDFLAPMRITGVGGTDLHEHWGGDARAYLGTAIPGFPNLFCVYGPNTNLVVNGSIILFSEFTVHYILQSVKYLLENGYDAMDCKEDAFEKYNDEVDRANRLMAWGASDVSSWYKNATGRVSQNWPFPLLDYWALTRDVDAGAFNFSAARGYAFSIRAEGTVA